MARELHVVALARDGWHSEKEHLEFSAALVHGMYSNTGLVMDYVQVDDLVDQIDLLLTIDPDKPCLKSLEIWAHGNPGLIDNLSDGVTWGAKLKMLNWCDVASIYLAGCNTGLQLGPRYPATRRVPIAKSLADGMRYDPAHFSVHLTVFGAAGYLSGCHSIGHTETVQWFWETEWHIGLQFPPIRPEISVFEPYDGSRDAQGDQVWNSFDNWR